MSNQPNRIERLKTALADRYRVERELGVGGMATVYLAEDLRHDRKVAIKVLKPELAAVLGAERFIQEIKTTASLQHPHILPLFDSGEVDSFLFYVMPYIEGETLREKLDREKQLGIEEAVKLTTESADALEYAHQQGVIHRDIKPENILLHAGRPLVADFGIALAVSAAAGGRMTETGLSLGTPHYMSPEQATAEKDLTNRSDIYSLGAVLYEMLTGSPPHVGSSAQQIIMKIVTEEAQPVTKVRKSVPLNVAAAVAKALEKLPADRFESAARFAEALTNQAFTLPTMRAAAVGAPARGPWNRLSVTTTALAALLLIVALWGWLRPTTPTAAQPPMHLQLALQPDERLGVTAFEQEVNVSRPSRTAFAFAPDGRSLVYVGDRGQLFVRALDSESATPIAGIEGAESPFFSPDGSSLGFWAARQLQRVALSGGPASTIMAMGRITGASWGADDRIVVGAPLGLIVLSATGALPPDTLAEPGAVLPQFLPGGKSIIFTTGTESTIAPPRLEWMSLRTGERRVLLEDAADARVLPTGHLLFASGGALLAASFDLGRNQLTAAPFTLLPDVMQALNGANSAVRTGAMQVAVSPLGQLAYLTGGVTPDDTGTLSWLDRQGRRTPIEAVGASPFIAVRLSPDGTRLAVSASGRHNPLRVLDLARQTSRSYVTGAAQSWLAWTPDSRRIVTRGLVRDSLSLVWFPVDGSAVPQPLLPGLKFRGDPMWWSPDGSELVAWRREAGPGSYGMDGAGVYGISLTDSAVRRIPDDGRGRVFDPALSPDGERMAFNLPDDGGGGSSVYVEDLTSGGRRKVSTENAFIPVWTKDGRELVYLSPAGEDSTGPINRVMAVAVHPGPEFAADPPRELFRASFIRTSPWRSHDISADGERFYVINSTAVPSPPGELHIVTNWFTVLERLAAQQGGRE